MNADEVLDMLLEIARAADNFENVAGEVVEADLLTIKGDGDGTALFIGAFNELVQSLKPYRAVLELDDGGGEMFRRPRRP
jgi:hypothetical protein